MMVEQKQMREMTRQTWAAGDYPTLSKTLLPMAAKVVRVAGVRPGERVLDVASGTGPVAITARRAGAEVVALDITPELLAQGEREAARAGVAGIEWREGDAEELPFPDASFDAVLSTVGHMFAPHPDVVVREMLRVTKPGGRIAFATWAPDAAVGAMISTTGRYAPRRGPSNPLDWGVPSIVAERFAGAREVTFWRDAVMQNVLSPEEFWSVMSEKFGPLVMTLKSLQEPAKRESLRRDFIRGVEPWFAENQLRLDYLVTRVAK